MILSLNPLLTFHMHMCSGTLEAQLDEDVKKHEAALEGTSKQNQAAFWPVSVCDAKYFF